MIALDLPGHGYSDLPRADYTATLFIDTVQGFLGHPSAFASLVHHWPTREAERERYGDIRVPVLLLYGEHDWSHPAEGAETARRIPGAESLTVARAGHFLSFDFMHRLPGPAHSS